MTTPSPFPAAERPAPSTHDDQGNPWSSYVRHVEFVDSHPSADDAAPIHVLTSPVLFDGVMVPARIEKEGITVDLSGRDGTVVTLWVHEDDVQIGHRDGETYVPHLIGGRRVCTPVGKGWDWVPVDPDDRQHNPYIACSFYVARVTIR